VDKHELHFHLVLSGQSWEDMQPYAGPWTTVWETLSSEVLTCTELEAGR
jgi:hypothetical protein